MAEVDLDGVDRFWSSGSADTAGTSITDHTRFRIASLTKPFVAALVMQARDEHLLSLDQTVSPLLRGVLPDGDPITVRMLLNHTSGVFDEVDDGNPAEDLDHLHDPDLQAQGRRLMEEAAHGGRVVYPDRLIVALSETHPRYFAPGTGYHYSTTDYQLAAMVLRAATGAAGLSASGQKMCTR